MPPTKNYTTAAGFHPALPAPNPTQPQGGVEAIRGLQVSVIGHKRFKLAAPDASSGNTLGDTDSAAQRQGYLLRAGALVTFPPVYKPFDGLVTVPIVRVFPPLPNTTRR